MTSSGIDAAAFSVPPRPGVKERRRERILRKAAEVLYEVGLRRATMDDIARALNTSKIALYRYFPNKDELIAAVLREVADAFVAAEHRPWAGLKRSLRRSLEIARATPPAFLLLVKSAANDPEVSPHFHRVRDVMLEATRRRIVLLGNPVAGDPVFLEVATRGLIDYLFAALAYWVENGDPARDAEWLTRVARSGTLMLGWKGDERFGTLPAVLAQDEHP